MKSGHKKYLTKLIFSAQKIVYIAVIRVNVVVHGLAGLRAINLMEERGKQENLVKLHEACTYMPRFDRKFCRIFSRKEC